jgi:hypothetical protein
MNMIVGVLSFVALLFAGHVQEPGTAMIRVDGAVEKLGTWTTERLTKEFAGDIRTVPYTLKGEKGEARCVPLLTLVRAARPRLDPKRKNHLVAFVVIVRAEDGYAAAFSLGELLPENGKREVWVAQTHLALYIVRPPLLQQSRTGSHPRKG